MLQILSFGGVRIQFLWNCLENVCKTCLSKASPAKSVEFMHFGIDCLHFFHEIFANRKQSERLFTFLGFFCRYLCVRECWRKISHLGPGIPQEFRAQEDAMSLLHPSAHWRRSLLIKLVTLSCMVILLRLRLRKKKQHHFLLTIRLIPCVSEQLIFPLGRIARSQWWTHFHRKSIQEKQETPPRGTPNSTTSWELRCFHECGVGGAKVTAGSMYKCFNPHGLKLLCTSIGPKIWVAVQPSNDFPRNSVIVDLVAVLQRSWFL